MDKSSADKDISWLSDRCMPIFQAPQHLRVYDMRTSSREVQLTVATLVGLINRPQPEVYLISRRNDTFWLQEVLSSLPHDVSSVTGDDILKDLLAAYRDRAQGIIIYDPDLSDSINIATMLAGQRDGIIVSPTQVSELQGAPYELPVLVDLREYGWKSRLQAYRWAKQNLLNQSTPHIVAGLPPDIPLGIRSFLVAARSFIYWLDPRNFLPDPRSGWQSERCLMRQILRTFGPQVAHLGWFINEGTGVMMTSQEAKPVLASDYFANLEVWASVQAHLPTSAVATTAPAVQKSAAKTYVSFTFSEGDNLQYIQERMLELWQDPARGSIPLGWVTSPVLLEAAPAIAAYYVRTATANDEFIAGPSGAGYIFPSWWPRTQLSAYLQRTGQLMERMNLHLLQILDSNILQKPWLAFIALRNGSGMALINKPLQQRFAQELAPFGVRGLLSGAGQSQASWRSFDEVLVYQNVGLVANVGEAVVAIKEAAAK
ncbi:MAG: GxGYxYP domain-containing protein, partial [Ktedonobacteraceae bacterium]